MAFIKNFIKRSKLSMALLDTLKANCHMARKIKRDFIKEYSFLLPGFESSSAPSLLESDDSHISYRGNFMISYLYTYVCTYNAIIICTI